MIFRPATLALVVALCAAPIVAHAQAPDAVAAFGAGRYEAAAEAGEAAGDAASLALAARALNARTLLAGAGGADPASVARALRLAEAALAKEPGLLEGRLQRATALGFQARRLTPGAAWRQGLVQRARSEIDAAIRTNPREAWGHALLGGWHMEAVRRGGPAAALIGASERAGRAAFGRALALETDEPAAPFYFALSLLALDFDAHRAEAQRLLARAQGDAARGAFDREIQARARELAAALEADPARARTLAARWL
jgi:hypothetical protein